MKFLDKTITGTGDSDKHILMLYSIAVSYNCKTIFELGVRNGTTTEPLLHAAKENNGALYSVDKVKSSFEPENEYKKHWDFCHMDSIDFLSLYLQRMTIGKVKSPDLVYVDDWHSYRHVKKELELLDQIVTPKTIILLHDLMYGETCPYYHTDLTLKDGQWAEGGPYRAVAELNPQFWEFATFPFNNGLTLLRKKYTNKYAR